MRSGEGDPSRVMGMGAWGKIGAVGFCGFIPPCIHAHATSGGRRRRGWSGSPRGCYRHVDAIRCDGPRGNVFVHNPASGSGVDRGPAPRGGCGAGSWSCCDGLDDSRRRRSACVLRRRAPVHARRRRFVQSSDRWPHPREHESAPGGRPVLAPPGPFFAWLSVLSDSLLASPASTNVASASSSSSARSVGTPPSVCNRSTSADRRVSCSGVRSTWKRTGSSSRFLASRMKSRARDLEKSSPCMAYW